MAQNEKKIRISGVAREYNVGAGTLIDFLSHKGIKIDGPNAVIDGDTYAVLSKEFAGKDVEKVNIREKIRPLTESVSISDNKAAQSKATGKTESEAPETQPKELQIKDNSLFSPHKANVPKVVGHIDLSPKKKEVAAPVVEPKVEAKAEPKVEARVEAKAEPVVEKVVQSAASQAAGMTIEQEVAAVAEKVVKAAKELEKEVTKVVEKSAEKIVRQVTKTVAQAELSALEAAEKMVDKVAQKIAQPKVDTAAPVAPVAEGQKGVDENGLFRANDPERLSGPKILGKIELPVAVPKGAAARSANAAAEKGRRNRIKKNKVDVASAAPTTAAGNRNAPGTGGAGRPAGGRGPQGHNGPGGRPTQAGGGNRHNQSQRPSTKPVVRAEVTDEDVQKQIKDTLARLTNKGKVNKNSAKYRKDKRDMVHGRMAEQIERDMADKSTLQVTEFVTVSELATMMEVSVTQVITACMNLGLMVSINQRLDAEALVIVAEEFGYKVEFVGVDIAEAIDQEVDSEEDLLPRPPIVTVMGHVDHGKTSLLDYIRKANVIAGEAGGITQHIGAYSVKLDDDRRVTFLDTPGHEAFTAMRARGAKVTDIAIIIIAADDAIMPQTIEAINHAAAAGVPMVFAINKIDKPGANPERIKEQLSTMNYLVEDWGGKYQSQDIAAKSGVNVDKLLEKVLLEAEMLDLKANPNRKASGSVIESTLDKGRGYVTTVLVHSGTLKVGDVLLSGIYTGRVKAMFNERGKKITQAPPATPVLVLGLNGASQAGDLFNVMDDDKQAREIASKREQLQRMQGLRTQKHVTLDEIGRRIAIGSFKELNIIIKGDVDGSIEALTDSLIKLSNEEVQVNVIHKAVGQISESDVLLATASNAIIIGFQVRPSAAARRLAEKEEIDVRLYSIIYDAINEVKDAIEGMLAPETKEEITCSVEILEVFKISKVGTVAGCLVREGKITRQSKIRIIRDGIVVYTGKLGSLKRFKDDAKEVGSNLECGLNIENFNDLKVGDFIEGYEQVEVARKLS